MADPNLLEQAIFSRLRTFSAATTVFSGRIYSLLAPEEKDRTYPLCAYWRVGAEGRQAHNLAAGTFRTIMRFACYGTDYFSAKLGAQAIRLTFDAFQGTVSGVRISPGLYQSETDFYDPQANIKVFSTNVEVIFWHD